jgi:chaperone BCS1
MFRKFYPDVNELLVDKFVEAAIGLGKNLSPASVQGHFMFHKTHPEDAIANLHRLR